MTRLFVDIPGLPDYVELCGEVEFVPCKGDRIQIYADRLACGYSRKLLEATPAYHCFERNEVTEKQNLAVFLKDCIITVSARNWSYEGDNTCCVLDVEVEW